MKPTVQSSTCKQTHCVSVQLVLSHLPTLGDSQWSPFRCRELMTIGEPTMELCNRQDQLTFTTCNKK